MPCLETNFLEKLKVDYKTFPNFIETGTFLGQTIFPFEPLFDKLYTIEIKEDLFTQTKQRYAGNKINFYHGDSSDVLKEILPSINDRSIIYLDAHWSCGITGRGVKDVPLYEELTSIIDLHKNETIIIVDDVRLFGKGPNIDPNRLVNWEDINIQRILNMCESRITDKYLLPSELSKNDRLVIHLSQT